MATQVFDAGNYRFIPAVSQYSGGVAAQPGYRIERVRFSRVIALREGFERIERFLADAGRPTAAFCACELRSPAPFTEQGFRDFNAVYIQTLSRWGLMHNQTNPVARSNVCPEYGAPAEPSFHAFSYVVPAQGEARPSCVISGSAEARPRPDARLGCAGLADVNLGYPVISPPLLLHS